MAVTIKSNPILYKPRRGETFQVVVNYPSDAEIVNIPQINYTGSQNGWITKVTNTKVTDQDYTYEIVVSENTSSLSSPRTANITFRATTSTGSESNTLSIYQLQSYNSLWRDEVMTMTRASNMSYILTDESDKQLYKGVAAITTTATGYNRIELNIPRIVDGLFEHPFFNPDSDGNWSDTGLAHIIALRTEANAHPSRVFPLIYDWSYDRSNYKYRGDIVLNDPINNHSAPWMYQPLSIYNDTNADYFTVAYRGNEEIATFDFGRPDFQTAEVMAYFDENTSQAERVVIYANDKEHPVIEYDLTHCGEWALYYLNRKGGHDAFMIEGNVRVVDNYSRDQYTRNARNTDPSSFAKTTIQNRISTTYELSTGWLTDEESEILASQLMPSPQVFLHNKNSPYIPTAVNIIDTSVEHKKFRNGKQLNRYTITVEESQTKLFK